MTKLILSDENSILEVLEFKKVWILEIKQELQKNVEFSKNLTITDFEDLKQFEIVKSTKNGYVKTRNTIKRAFKSKRDEYNSLSKENLEAEREVIWVIEAEEKRLDELIETAEKMKLRKQNESKLNERIESLKKYDYVANNDILLEMTEKEFWILLQNKRELFLQIQEQKIKEENEKIARAKELEEVKKEAKLEAEKEAEAKRIKDLENARIEKENEIAKIKKEQEDKELAEKKKREDEDKDAKEKQERLEKETKYKEYIKTIDFDKYEKEDWKIIFYKKVWEFVI